MIGTNLRDTLVQMNHNIVVVVGLTADHCVLRTTRMAGNFGYNTYLISDATATFEKLGQNGEIYASELIHKTALASLDNEFAKEISSKKLFDIY